VRFGAGEWKARFLPKASDELSIDRQYVLWGRGWTAHGEWACYSEANGARVWIPTRFAGPDEICLRVREIIDFDPVSGLAGIVDAMICGF
jgi:hypothetical protein